MSRKTSFYYSFLVLPAEQRRAIVAVWDFCRAVDDAVDEAPSPSSASPSGSAGVTFWRGELARCFNGVPPSTEQGRSLQPFISRFDLPQEDLAKAGCTVADLAGGVASEPVRQLIAFECRRAREFYERARAALAPEDRKRLMAAEIMRAVYFETLRRIERSGYDVF